MKNTHSFVAAGVLSGLANMLAFLVLHHLWIQPIWFILPLGLALAVSGGLAIGWAYSELARGLPSQPWTTLAVFFILVMILLPPIILAELRTPMFDISSEPAILAMSVARAALIFIGELVLTAILMGAVAGWLIFIGELVLTAILMGAVAGWLIGKTPRAAVTTAIAGLIFALGPGHNIPLIGSTPDVGKELLIMTIVIFTSSLALVGTQKVLSNLQRMRVIGGLESFD